MKKPLFKKLVSLALCLVMLFSVFSFTEHAGVTVCSLSGTGTSSNPYVISSPSDLAAISDAINSGNDFTNNYFILGNDIIFPYTGRNNFKPIGTSAAPFAGNFNGRGYSVSGLYINSSSDYQGLFGYIGSIGVVENLGVVNSVISGNRYVGGIAGYCSGTIRNCFFGNSNTKVFSMESAYTRPVASQTDSAVIVDGIFSEGAWRTDEWATVNSEENSQVTISPYSDYSFSYKALWDNNNLYVGIKTNVTPSVGDYVRVWLNPTNSKSTLSLANKDIILNMKYNSSGAISISTDGSGITTATASAAVVSSCVAGDGYWFVETRIPFSMLGLTPSANTAMGFFASSFIQQSPANEGYGTLHSVNATALMTTNDWWLTCADWDTLYFSYPALSAAAAFPTPNTLGRVTGSRNVGGIAGGLSTSGRLVNCLNLCAVICSSTTNAGSVVGSRNVMNYLTNCYYNKSVSTLSGVANTANVTAKVEGKTTAECIAKSMTEFLQNGCSQPTWIQGDDGYPLLLNDSNKTEGIAVKLKDGSVAYIQETLTPLGAAIKYDSANSGIRFGYSIAKNSFYRSVIEGEQPLIKSVAYGALIQPSDSVGSKGLTLEAAESDSTIANILAADYMYDNGAVRQYSASIRGFAKSQFNRTLSARGYVKYTFTDSTEYTLYTAITERSYYSVAKSIRTGTTLTPANLALCNGLDGIIKAVEGEPLIITKPKLAYIPIDDRPANTDRVKYLAGSLDYELLMPDSDYYMTRLDGQALNTNGEQYGNRQALMNWLKSVDAECDYFVISLDQMLSGGLVNSRDMNNTDLSFEYSIIDYLITLSANNKIVFFDTVMRLASTVGYSGYTINEYEALRNYGITARATLSGSNLTINNIVAGYRYNASGAVVSTTLSSSVITKYHNSRARKLRLIDYLLTNCDRTNSYYYIGVDDSSPNVTIQTNEINYITNKLGSSGILFSGTDELGMMGVTKLYTQTYGKSYSVNVKYYGGKENYAADSYDIGTLKKTVDDHLTSLGATIKTSDSSCLQLLVLTAPLSSSSKTTYVNNLISQAKSNITNHIPTIVIDASSNTYSQLLQTNLLSQLSLGALLGYSNWNTAANALGIALSQGVGRYLYLTGNDAASEDSNKSFIKSLTFAYVKDIAYKFSGSGAVNNYISSVGSTSNFYSSIYSSSQLNTINNQLGSIVMSGSHTFTGNSIVAKLNSSKIITSLKNYSEANIGTVTVNNFSFPWYRTFEIRFEISVN